MTEQPPASETTESGYTTNSEAQPPKAVFRIPGTAYLGIAFLAFCITPMAFGGIPGLQALYVIPLALVFFVWRTRTLATKDGLDTRTLFGHRTIPWPELKGLVITKNARVRAVLNDETEVPLPTVRVRHLPVLSLVSEGRLPDPSGLVNETSRREEDPRAEVSTEDRKGAQDQE